MEKEFDLRFHDEVESYFNFDDVSKTSVVEFTYGGLDHIDSMTMQKYEDSAFDL